MDSLQLTDAMIQAYLQQLGLQRKEPDMAFLRDINRAHVASFAFSSVGPLLGDELPLDAKSLFQRIVVKQRGGYCFEQNGLMYEILAALGFSANLYLGRVIYDQDIHPGLTHRITTVEMESTQYIVDVGFGPLGPALPISMSGSESRQGYRKFRVREADGGQYHLQTIKDDSYFSLYRFELANYGQADCELGHFWSHKHPSASFVNNLVVSRIFDHETLSLRNRVFYVSNGTSEKSETVHSATQLEDLLNTRFDLSVSPTECNTLFTKTARLTA